MIFKQVNANFNIPRRCFIILSKKDRKMLYKFSFLIYREINFETKETNINYKINQFIHNRMLH